MKAEFSEFTYGYAIIREYEERIGKKIRILPLLPSMRKEKYLGYDVKFVSNKNIFLQFKISDFLKSNKAKEWWYFRRPYYRFRLEVSQLFNLFILSRTSENNIVRYVAPVFYKLDDLLQHYQTMKVMKNSIFIPPNIIVEELAHEKVIDAFNKKHSVGYCNNQQFTIFSKPINIDLTELDEVERDIVKNFMKDLKYLSFIDFIKSLRNMTLKFIESIHEKSEYFSNQAGEEYVYLPIKHMRLLYKFKEKLSIDISLDNIDGIIETLCLFYNIYLGSQLYIVVDYSRIECECKEVAPEDGGV